MKMWGIGAKTPNRLSLVADDCILIYVGAPEYAFIGDARLASPTHDWTPAEASKLRERFESGVVFESARAWPHPVPLKSVIAQLDLAETNPGAHFFSGVVRITARDYATVIAAEGAEPSARALEPETDRPKVTLPEHTRTAGDGRPIDVDLLFRTVEKLKGAEGLAGSLSEYDTRAEFIDKYLEALGYTELGDIQRGSPTDSGDFPDYVLHVHGKAAVAIEAKKLGSKLGAKEAGQLVGYCANLGVRWGAVTDGRVVKLYDAPLLGVSPEERRVLLVDLTEYRDRDDFEARISPELALIAKSELESGAGLERRVALEAVRELLIVSGSKTARTLRKELDEVRKIKLSSEELSELVSELLS